MGNLFMNRSLATREATNECCAFDVEKKTWRELGSMEIER